MAQLALRSVARQLGSLFDGGSVAGLSDCQLLERFTASRAPAGEAAFAALVARHGPMVLGVCRKLLGDHHHAEDAFQAVFLVLARQAKSIRNPEMLGAWLYGVARRTALATRGRIARRDRTELERAVRQPAASLALAADRVALEHEQAEALHREINSLPGVFRAPLELCYFEGLTLDEAAHRLQWPPGTLRSRLARARVKLRRGLTRDGFVPAAAATARADDRQRQPLAILPSLCDSTARAAVQFASARTGLGPLSEFAEAIARDVLSTLAWHKLKVAGLALFLVGFVAAGLGWLSRSPAMAAEPAQAKTASQAPLAQRAEPAATRPAHGRMTVGGRVLDPRGNPVPNAAVIVHGARRQGGDILRVSSNIPAALGEAKCDGAGRFNIEMPRIRSATHYMIGAAALAPGFGVGWVDLDIDAELPTAEITLRPEQVIEGRLFDVTGQAAQGVRVSVEAIGFPQNGPESLPDGLAGGPQFWSGNSAQTPQAWPKPAISDALGQFTIRGVGRDLRVSILLEDPRFARQRIKVDASAGADTTPTTAVMEPAKVIFGRVTFEDTRKPVPHVPISIWAYKGGPAYPSDHETDADGNFRAIPFSTEQYSVAAQAPDDQPYLSASTGSFEWTKGTFERRVDLVLRRGVMLHGKVVEAGSGQPVEGAALGYVIRESEGSVPAARARTRPDGSFQFAVLPTPGTLAIIGPSDEFVFEERGERMLREGRAGGRRQYAHAFVSCDLKPGVESRQLDVVLGRGATVKASVVTPLGEPVKNAWVFSRLLLEPEPWATRRFSGRFHGDVHNGHCELHGLAQGADVAVYFLDSKNRLGATTEFSAKTAADGPVTVRLEPCGTAMARLVDAKGIPLPNYRDPYLISMIVTPGRDGQSQEPADQDLPVAVSDYLSRIDPDHYKELASDAEGRVTFPALIPGATYRVTDMTTRDDPGGRKTRKLFVARAAEAIELGEILIEKPDPVK